MKIKHWIVMLLFLVSWQTDELQLHVRYTPLVKDGQGFPNCESKRAQEAMGVYVACIKEEYMTVETVDHSIKLKTQDDVDKFVGKEKTVATDTNGLAIYINKLTYQGGIISDKAFNVKVKELP